MSQNEEHMQSSEEKLLHLQALIEQDNQALVCEFFSHQADTEIALLLESFPPNHRKKIWLCVPEEIRGEVLVELNEDVRTSLMSEMESAEVSELTKDLAAQDIAEILDTVHDSVKEEVIGNLNDSTREHVQTLHVYEDDAVYGSRDG